MKKVLNTSSGECVHRNILQLIETHKGREVVLCQEICDGSLAQRDFLEAASSFDNDTKVDLCRQIMAGITKLHELNVWHCNIKPSNILYKRRSANSIVIKVADMGIYMNGNYSKEGGGGVEFADVGVSENLRGVNAETAAYMPREILTDVAAQTPARSIAHDVFSLGCMFHFVLTSGAHPFSPEFVMGGISFSTLSRIIVERIVRATDPPRITPRMLGGGGILGAIMSREAFQGAGALIKRLTDPNPENRGDLIAVQNDPFFKNE